MHLPPVDRARARGARARSIPAVFAATAIALAVLPGGASAQAGDGAPVAQDLEGARALVAEGLVSIELSVPRREVYVGEVVPLALRIELDRAFLEERMIQPFRRRLDVPVQVEAPWRGEPAGARLLPPAPVAGPTLAVGDDVVTARRLDSGTDRVVLELVRELAPTRPGTLALPAPALRLAHATRFRQDPFAGRVPEDRVDSLVRGAPLELTVRPLPELGRPAGFTGAVGPLELSADASPRALRAGETLRLWLRVEGPGDLSRFDPPRLDRLPGFHALGLLDEPQAGARLLTYDLVPESPRVDAIPPIELPVFDPTPPAGYRVLRTESIPIEVAPAADAPAATSAPPGSRGPREDPARPALSPPAVAALSFLALALAVLALALGRRRATPGEEEAPARAATALEAELAGEEVDVLAAFTRYLARLLDCPPPAVESPDLAARLVRAGLSRDAAARAKELFDRLLAARYGDVAAAGAPPPDAVELRELARDAASRPR